MAPQMGACSHRPHSWLGRRGARGHSGMYGRGSGLRLLPHDLGLTRTFLWDRSLRGHRLPLVTGRNSAWLTSMSCLPSPSLQEWPRHLSNPAWQMVPGSLGAAGCAVVPLPTPPPPKRAAGCLCPCPVQWQQRVRTHRVSSQSALASASPGRQMANAPCQCREGLRRGRPGEHCGSALLRNLLWLPSFSQWEAPLQGEPKRLGGGAQLHSDLLQSLRQVTQTT